MSSRASSGRAVAQMELPVIIMSIGAQAHLLHHVGLLAELAVGEDVDAHALAHGLLELGGEALVPDVLGRVLVGGLRDGAAQRYGVGRRHDTGGGDRRGAG